MTRQERYKQHLIESFRRQASVKEEAPAMSSGTGGFASGAAAAGPVAGFDPILGAGKKTYAKGRVAPSAARLKKLIARTGGVSATKQSKPTMPIGDVTSGLV